MLGNSDFANKARSLYLTGDYAYVSGSDGWEYLGAGCSRAAFLGPDGVVYKVLTREGEEVPRGCPEHFDYDTANQQEYDNYLLLSEHLPARLRLAECFLWADVLAMEYVEGINPTWSATGYEKELEALTKLSHGTIMDTFGDNARIVEGVLVLVDYAW